MGVETTKPTADQLEIARMGLEGLRRASAANDNLADVVLSSMRLTKDQESGKIRQMTDQEFMSYLPETERQNFANFQEQVARQSRALKGTLPVSEGLAQQKRDQFRQFKEAQNRLGNQIIGDDPMSATASSTAGYQALREFNTTFKLAEDAERRSEIQTGQANVANNMGLIADIQSRKTNEAKALPLKNLFALPTFQNNAGILAQQQFSNAAAQNERTNDYLGLGGQAAGLAGYGLIRKFFP